MSRDKENEKKWYEFAASNLGYVFLNIKSGEKLTKLQFFLRFVDEPRKLNLATHDALNGWIHHLKPGWVIGDIAPGVRGPIRKDSLPAYKRFKDKE